MHYLARCLDPDGTQVRYMSTEEFSVAFFVRTLREDHLRILLGNLLYAGTDDFKVFIPLRVRERALLGDRRPHRRSQILIEVVVEIP
jgi:hypothetical protein